MSNGRFFDKRATSKTGNFFRDLPGRDTAEFNKTAAVGVESYIQGSPQPMTTGFHRPSKLQPEALEAGMERFTTGDAQGVTGGLAHGVIEGGKVRSGALAQSQHAKTAADLRFLGTSFAKQAFRETAGEILEGAGLAAQDVGEGAKNIAYRGVNAGKDLANRAVEAGIEGASEAGKGVDRALKNKWVDLALLAGGTLLGAKLLGKGVGRVARAFKGAPAPPPPPKPGLLSSIAQGAKHVLFGPTKP